MKFTNSKSPAPLVAQLKTGVPLPSVKRPVAPPVYRPQPVPKVLQTKRSPFPSPIAVQARTPVTHPVYRPEAKKMVQPRALSQQRTLPTPPPAYRPQQKRIAQPKITAAAQPSTHPKAAPVYRPQPTRVNVLPGRSLQMKTYTPVPPGASQVVQLGRAPRKVVNYRARAKKSAETRFGSCNFNPDRTVANAVFYDRPSSNSRRGQGDHVVSYTLITQTVATSVRGKTVDQAGKALANVLAAAKAYVSTGAINSWWHKAADTWIKTLNSLSPDKPGSEGRLRAGINDVLSLLNKMPGTAVKNKKSTKGHGEGGSKGGLYQAEQDVKKGKLIVGNIWVNVLNMFDGAADKSIMETPAKLESKLQWLMELFSRAAPTVFGLLASGDLTLLPGTNLDDAASTKFGDLKGMEVAGVIEEWLEGSDDD